MPEPSSHQLGGCLASGCLPGNNLTSQDSIRIPPTLAFVYSHQTQLWIPFLEVVLPEACSPVSPELVGNLNVPSVFLPWLALFLLTSP